MQGAYIVKNTTVVYGVRHEPITGKAPISHPKNCREECPYGYDRAFCFPCYKKLMEGMPKKRKG